MAVIAALVTIKNPSSYTASSCFIAPQMPCYAFSALTNSSASSYVLEFSNNLNVEIAMPQNAFSLQPTLSSQYYYGQCLPAILPPRAIAVCNATVPKYTPPVGSQINPRFVVSYEICSKNICAAPIYNTSGSATTTFTQYVRPLIDRITLLTNTGTGYVSIADGSYPSNTPIYLLYNQTYTAFAIPPKGHGFLNWAHTSSVIINSSSSQSISVRALGSGALQANFT